MDPIIIDNFVPHLVSTTIYDTYDDNWHVWVEAEYSGNTLNDPTFTERDFNTWLYGLEREIHGSHPMLVRLYYSEIIDPPNVLPISMYTILGDSATYFSTTEFTLVTDPYLLEEAELNDHESDYRASCWSALFETDSLVLPPQYLGKIQLTIDDTFSGGVDIAGNLLDMDASTVVPPRSGPAHSNTRYEHDSFVFPGFAPWGDISHYENVSSNITCENSDNRAISLMRGYYTINSIVKDSIEIELNDPDIISGNLMYGASNIPNYPWPDCTYYEGFWVASSGDYYPSIPLNMYIVKGDGSHITLEVHNGSEDIGTNMFNCIQTDCRYGWIAWERYYNNIQHPYVTDVYMMVTVYDSQNLSNTYTEEVGFGNKTGEHYSYISILGESMTGPSGSIVVALHEYNYENDTTFIRQEVMEPPVLDTSTALTNSNFSSASIEEVNESGMVLQNQLRYPTPNPSETFACLSFQLESPGLAELSVFDLSGRLVSIIVSENLTSGDHRLIWNLTDENGNPVPSGIYCIRLVSGSFTENKRLLVIR